MAVVVLLTSCTNRGSVPNDIMRFRSTLNRLYLIQRTMLSDSVAVRHLDETRIGVLMLEDRLKGLIYLQRTSFALLSLLDGAWITRHYACPSLSYKQTARKLVQETSTCCHVSPVCMDAFKHPYLSYGFF